LIFLFSTTLPSLSTTSTMILPSYFAEKDWLPTKIKTDKIATATTLRTIVRIFLFLSIIIYYYFYINTDTQPYYIRE
jgi:hypothetical protein